MKILFFWKLQMNFCGKLDCQSCFTSQKCILVLSDTYWPKYPHLFFVFSRVSKVTEGNQDHQVQRLVNGNWYECVCIHSCSELEKNSTNICSINHPETSWVLFINAVLSHIGYIRVKMGNRVFLDARVHLGKMWVKDTRSISLCQRPLQAWPLWADGVRF